MSVNTDTASMSSVSQFSSIRHDDMLGILGTWLAWWNQWNVKNINNTLYPLWFLRDNSADFTVVRIQSPHWRKQGEVLDSIHMHYVLDTAPTAGQTALFDVYYTRCYPWQAIPVLASWTSVLWVTWTFTWTEPQRQYEIKSLVTNVPAPTTEWYWLYLLVRIVRGNGTYAWEIGVVDVDAHAQKDRLGSINEFTD